MTDRRGSAQLPKKRGTCELCGGHDRELMIMAIGDFIGWACAECIAQLRECQVRRYCGCGEETEPGE